MKDLSFRDLTADDVEVRIDEVREKYIRLLLYKNARVDYQILSDTVGSMYWQKNYRRDEKGNLICCISIWDDDKKQWVKKEDVGAESRTDATKGEYSDASKRSCTSWCIGIELYTAPEIKIWTPSCDIRSRDGKYYCYDRFTVSHMKVEKKHITELQIINDNTGVVVFDMQKAPKVAKVEENVAQTNSKPTEFKAKSSKTTPPTTTSKPMDLTDALNCMYTAKNGRKVSLRSGLKACKDQESQTKMLEFLKGEVRAKSEIAEPCLLIFQALQRKEIDFVSI